MKYDKARGLGVDVTVLHCGINGLAMIHHRRSLETMAGLTMERRRMAQHGAYKNETLWMV